MQPRVGLNDYRFLNFSLRWVQGQKNPVAQEPYVVVSEGKLERDSAERVAALDVTLAPNDGHSGYELSLKIMGIFSLELNTEEVNEDKLRYLATLNGATILYGIIRAEVASLTSNFPGGRLVLPAVYMSEVMKQQSDSAASQPVRESIEE